MYRLTNMKIKSKWDYMTVLINIRKKNRSRMSRFNRVIRKPKRIKTKNKKYLINSKKINRKLNKKKVNKRKINRRKLKV